MTCDRCGLASLPPFVAVDHLLDQSMGTTSRWVKLMNDRSGVP